jgi:hypothetical protein
MALEYFGSQLSARLRRVEQAVDAWLFQDAPEQAAEQVEHSDAEDSDDDIPLGILFVAPEELCDFAFSDPDSDLELEDRPGVALWGCGSLTLTTPAELREGSSASALAKLGDSCDAYAVWLDERPALRVLLRYRASVQLQVVKMFVCHFGRQPRSEKKGTGLITVTGHCCEVVWEHGGDAYIDASAHLVPTRGQTQLVDGVRRVVRIRDDAKLVWQNLEDPADQPVWPSQHKYCFNTSIALGKLVPLHMLFVPVRHSLTNAKCPLPSGELFKACDANWCQHADKPMNLTGAMPSVRLLAGDPFFVIGYRCVSCIVMLFILVRILFSGGPG